MSNFLMFVSESAHRLAVLYGFKLLLVEIYPKDEYHVNKCFAL